MERIKVSFLVAIYNVEKYISHCIESISNIKNPNIEIILVNDGSNDNSLEICRAFAQKDARIRVIAQENKGLPDARNAGLTEAKGRWVCFVDGDDWLSEDFGSLIDSIDEKVDAVYFSYKRTRQQENTLIDVGRNGYLCKKELNKVRLSILNPSIMKKSEMKSKQLIYTSTWGKFFKRSIILKNELDFTSKISWGEDILFNFKMLRVMDSVQILNKIGYYYRVQSGSMTQSYQEDAVEKYSGFLVEIWKEIEKFDSENSAYLKFFWLFVVKQFLVIVQRDMFNKNSPKSYKNRKKRFLQSKKIPIIDLAFNQANISELSGAVRVGASSAKKNYFLILSLLYKVKSIKDYFKYEIFRFIHI